MRHPLALLVGLLMVHTTMAAPPTTAPYECHWTDHPIAIDGTADDPAWRHAAVIDHFQIGWKEGTERTPREATKAMLLWDGDYLYFHADMEDADLYAYGSHHQDTLWLGDVFELFFRPSAEQPAYYEFEVNPANLTLELAFPDRASVREFVKIAGQTKIEMKTAVKLRGTLNQPNDKDEGWSVTGRIPWKDLAMTGGRPQEGAVWTFALCRFARSTPPSKDEEASSSAPLKEKNFHRLEDYLPMKFVGPQQPAK